MRIKSLQNLLPLFLSFLSFSIHAQTGNVTTLAGSGASGSSNGTGTSAQFSEPRGSAVDTDGNVFIAEVSNHLIRKITPAGVVTTFAGSTTPGSANGTGGAAHFANPQDIAIDQNNNLYVADYSNHCIRKITPGAVVTTLAGGTAGFQNGTGTAARFNAPLGLDVDKANGILYVSEYNNHTIRKIIIATGVVTTLAGTGSAGFLNHTTGTSAQFNVPWGVALDGNGNLFVGDYSNHRVRKIVISTGVVTTYAGDGTAGYLNHSTATSAKINLPSGLCLDKLGNLYVASYGNNVINKISYTGAVTTFAGAPCCTGTSGTTNAVGTAARFNGPYGVSIDNEGNLYVGDASNNRVRKIENLVCHPGKDLPINTGSTVTHTGSYASAGADDWTHYCKSSGELLLSLKIGSSGAVVAANEVELKMGSSTVFTTTSHGGLVSNTSGYSMIDRRWNVAPTTQPSSNVGVRYYFTAAELANVISALNSTNYDDITELNMFKSQTMVSGGAAATAFADPHLTDGIVLVNGATPSTTVWKDGTQGTSDHYAEFKVSSFSGGGGGGGAGGGALPVNLINFAAKAQSLHTAKLDWATASEINNSHFVLERSYDGKSFKAIGTVGGNGNSQEVMEYSFVDETIATDKHIVFYRLNQFDFDGANEYSEVKKVDFDLDLDLDLFNVYPNPFTSEVYISTSNIEADEYNVVVHSLNGVAVQQMKVTNDGASQKLDLSSLLPGIYFLTISTEASVQNFRIIKN
jgi:streptogramin lyase